ncbi:MAG: hypothetical protein J6C37_07705 [Roseburia sp.]|nr:hypothetical protein [Roseburia sp.]
MVFGLGMCLTMQIIGNGILLTVIGVLIAVLGGLGMDAAYPVYRTVFNRTKAKFTPRILELTEEMTGERHSAI